MGEKYYRGDTEISKEEYEILQLKTKLGISESFVKSDEIAVNAKNFAEYIIKDGLLDESLGNVGTKTDGGILGFAKIFEDPKDGDGVALGVVTVDEMYEKFIGR